MLLIFGLFIHVTAGQQASCSDYQVSWSKFCKVCVSSAGFCHLVAKEEELNIYRAVLVCLNSFYTISFYITRQMKRLHVKKNFPCVLHSSRRIFPESPSVSGCGSTPSWSSLRDTCSLSGMRSEPLVKPQPNCHATHQLLVKIYWMRLVCREAVDSHFLTPATVWPAVGQPAVRGQQLSRFWPSFKLKARRLS